ncbi:MAG: multi-sensor Hybrid histidine Kinase [Candidatus Peregrinibacteria bacterium Greene1014_49]|nr:MAG: multi-sensor Hybrid histidine Kinase [Candidatus Peregrinibacteria bacterium Greene1014_49]
MLIVALAHMSVKNIRLNRDLQGKNATLRDITSFVSHQLRAPVTAMRWSMESLLDGDAGDMSDGVRKEIEELYKVVIQNAALINDILNISRLDRGVIEVKLIPTHLLEVAERAIRDYRVPAEKAGLKLSIENPDATITVTADGEKLAEAVSNAISNAIKHTAQGGITVKLRRDEKFGYIDVTDTGEGMSPEILAHLFDRAGIKGSNTDSSQSTGLGLFIARQFTRLMGGDVTVTSEVGRGSTFVYSVPLVV